MHRRNSEGGCGCLLGIIVAIINLSIGAMSVNYILSWFGKDIIWIGDAIIGLILGEISIPVAIVGWLLRLFGVF